MQLFKNMAFPLFKMGVIRNGVIRADKMIECEIT